MREEGGPRPSPRAAERLAADVGAKVADLRTALRRALDEAERLEAVGRQDLAVDVLEEQRDALVAVHRQLSDRLAAAAVEREAEHIVDAAASAPATNDGTLARLLASAAAAVAGIVLLTTPDLGGGVLEAAGWVSTSDTARVPAVDQPVADPSASAAAETAATETAAPAVADGVGPAATEPASASAEGDTERAPKPAPAPRDGQRPLLGVLDGVFRLVPGSLADGSDDPDPAATDGPHREPVERDGPIAGSDRIDLGESAEE